MRGRSFSISAATRRMGAMEARDDGTTSLSKTSVEKVVIAALRDGLLARACTWPDSPVLDIAMTFSIEDGIHDVPASVLIYPCQTQGSETNTPRLCHHSIT